MWLNSPSRGENEKVGLTESQGMTRPDPSKRSTWSSRSVSGRVLPPEQTSLYSSSTYVYVTNTRAWSAQIPTSAER